MPKSKEEKRQYSKEWNEKNKEILRAKAKIYYAKNRDKKLKQYKAYYQAHKKESKYKVYSKKVLVKLKDKFISMYGGKCMCCGESHKEFLTIDHVKGRRGSDGVKESTSKAYRNAIRVFDTSTYQLMCINCNFSKGVFGYCPHDVSKYLPSTQSPK